MSYLLIKDGKIFNHIAWDGATEYKVPEGCTLVKYEGRFNVGWDWNGTDAIAPPEPEPPVTEAPIPGGSVVIA